MNLESQLISAGLGPVAGVDEAGRGACCGPISIAACILPFTEIAAGDCVTGDSSHNRASVGADAMPKIGLPTELKGLADSKKLSARRREILFDEITRHATAYSIVMISASEIDRWGIQHANVSGMRRAVALLDPVPGYVLTDAVKVGGLPMPHLPILKGDQMAACISAASVLAKVARDRHMIELDQQYPGYGLASHKGYGTKSHMDAVSLHGATPQHRYTYKNVAQAHAAWVDAHN